MEPASLTQGLSNEWVTIIGSGFDDTFGDPVVSFGLTQISVDATEYLGSSRIDVQIDLPSEG